MSIANDNPRSLFRRLFRPAITSDHPGSCWRPAPPSSYWKTTIACPDFTSEPPAAFFSSINFAPCGRIVKIKPFAPSQPTPTYAIISFRRDIQRIPPHPGHRPPDLRTWMHPRWMTTDGSLGPFNESRYPQMFDPHRPWGGFHRFFVIPSVDFPESYNAVDFFDWSGIQEDEMIGGRWKMGMIDDLFRSRTQREASLANVLRQIGDPQGQRLFQRFNTHLPYFDPMTLEDTARWKRWIDGRDAIGYTIRYIAELGALHDWLLEVERQATVPLAQAPTRQDYSGLWVGTVARSEDWKFLFHSAVPLFGLFTVPEASPQSKQATVGTLDADEWYRNDPVLQNLPRFPSTYDKDFPLRTTFVPIPIANAAVRHIVPLPPGLQLAPPTQVTTVARRVDYSQSYTTYLFSDPHIPRSSSFQPSNRQKDLRRQFDRILTATTKQHLPPFARGTGSLRVPYHPLSSVLPRRQNGHEKRVFVEETCSIYSWLERKTRGFWRGLEDQYKYCHDLGGNDFVYSDNRWPLVEDDFEVYDDEDEIDDYAPHIVSGSRRRVYLAQEPSPKMLEKLPSDRLAMPPALERGYNNLPGTSTGVHRSTNINVFDGSDDDDDDLLNYPIRPRTGQTPPPVVAGDLYSDDDDLLNYTIGPRVGQTPAPVVAGNPNHDNNDLPEHPIQPNPRTMPLPLARRDQYSGKYSHPLPTATYSMEGLTLARAATLGDMDVDRPDGTTGMDIDGRVDAAESATATQAGAPFSSVPAPSAQLEDRQAQSISSPSLTLTTDAESRTDNDMDMAQLGDPPISSSSLPPSSEISSPTITSTNLTSTGSRSVSVEMSIPPSPHPPASSEILGPTVTYTGSLVPIVPPVSAPSIASTPGDDALTACLHRIHRARHLASAYMARRLNRPVLEPHPAECIQECTFSAGTSLTCYCLRISNVDVGSTSPQVALNTVLAIAETEDWGEILIISVNSEVDESWSVELGFRSVEDAIVMWTRHGKRHRGRHWDIQPVQAVLGITFVARRLQPTCRSLSERVLKLQSCQVLEEMLSQEDNTSLSSFRLIQIAEVLSTLHPDYATVDDSEQSTGPLIAQWAEDFVDTHDHGPLSSSPDLLERMYPRVLSQPHFWKSTPLPSLWAGSSYEREVIPFTPSSKPPKPEPSKATKKHQRHRVNDAKRPAPDFANPSKSRMMTSTERGMCRKHTRRVAEIKYSCWVSETLRLPPVPLKTENQPLVDAMLDLWFWHEDCFNVIQNAYAMSGLSSLPPTSQNTASAVMAESFFAAERSFAPASRLKKLFGPEYREVMQRIDTISNGGPPIATATAVSHGVQSNEHDSTNINSSSSGIVVSSTESWDMVTSRADGTLDKLSDNSI